MQDCLCCFSRRAPGQEMVAWDRLSLVRSTWLTRAATASSPSPSPAQVGSVHTTHTNHLETNFTFHSLNRIQNLFFHIYYIILISIAPWMGSLFCVRLIF